MRQQHLHITKISDTRTCLQGFTFTVILYLSDDRKSKIMYEYTRDLINFLYVFRSYLKQVDTVWKLLFSVV